jgi:NAD(P)H dehydrogenase (quinone)
LPAAAAAAYRRRVNPEGVPVVKILLVVAHPRASSLTASAAAAFAEAASANGHVVEMADLMAEGFDPVLREPDEPDWDDPAKVYSPEVRAEMARIGRNEATVMIFPVWWWSVPALLKGWIDRVWNYGWAYSGADYPHRKVWMIGIAGSGLPTYVKRGYDKAMTIQLETGVLDYCGIPEPRLEVLYGATESPEQAAQVLADARRLGGEF